MHITHSIVSILCWALWPLSRSLSLTLVLLSGEVRLLFHKYVCARYYTDSYTFSRFDLVVDRRTHIYGRQMRFCSLMFVCHDHEWSARKRIAEWPSKIIQYFRHKYRAICFHRFFVFSSISMRTRMKSFDLFRFKLKIIERNINRKPNLLIQFVLRSFVSNSLDAMVFNCRFWRILVICQWKSCSYTRDRLAQPLQRKNRCTNKIYQWILSVYAYFIRSSVRSLSTARILSLGEINEWMNEYKKKHARNRNSAAAANRLNRNLYSKCVRGVCVLCAREWVWPLRFVVVLISYYKWHELSFT